MEIRRKVSPGGLWRSLYPVLVYPLAQFLAQIFYALVILAPALIREQGLEPGDLEIQIAERLLEGTMVIIIFAAACTIPLFGWLYYRDIQKKKAMGWRDEWFPLTEGRLLWAVLGSAALALFCNQLVSLMPLSMWTEDYEEVSEALNTGGIWLQIIGAGFLAPAVEELMMRGLVYQRFRQMMRPGPAMFWSALAFGIFHGNVIQGIYAFLVGLFFAWLLERFQRILVPMVAHMSANLFVILLEDMGGMELIYGSLTGFFLSLFLSGMIALAVIRILRAPDCP